MSSKTVVAMAWYSASAENWDTMLCFFNFYKIRDCPSRTQYPITEWRVSEHEAQLESQ